MRVDGEEELCSSLLRPARASEAPPLPLLLSLSRSDPSIVLQSRIRRLTLLIPACIHSPSLSPTFACVYPSGTLHCINRGFWAGRSGYSISTHSLTGRRTERQGEKGGISINIAGAEQNKRGKIQ